MRTCCLSLFDGTVIRVQVKENDEKKRENDEFDNKLLGSVQFVKPGQQHLPSRSNEHVQLTGPVTVSPLYSALRLEWPGASILHLRRDKSAKPTVITGLLYFHQQVCAGLR